MTTKPVAHISVSKNRVKKGREVYLKDDTEFEIELYNPTEHVVCAKIWINGIQLSGGALVLKPAERFHLDRYLDEAMKFRFSTYDVSGSQEEIENAIKNNGLIQVKFYNEIIPVTQGIPIITNIPSYPDPYPYWNSGPSVFGPASNPNYFGCNSIIGVDDSNITLTSGTSELGQDGHDGVACNFSSSDISFNANDFLIEPVLNDEYKDDTPIESQPKIKESGRIEGGSKSDQEFTLVNMSFAFSPVAEYEYVILPVSQKIIETKEVGSKVYCTGCKLRKKKSQWQFCPKCGTEFEY